MTATLKTYTVLFARDIPHYGTAEIEAESDEAALAAAKACMTRPHRLHRSRLG